MALIDFPAVTLHFIMAGAVMKGDGEDFGEGVVGEVHGDGGCGGVVLMCHRSGDGDILLIQELGLLKRGEGCCGVDLLILWCDGVGKGC